MLVYPTPKALDMLPEIRGILKDWNEYITADIAEEDMAVFMAVLEKISKKSGEYCSLSENAGEGERL